MRLIFSIYKGYTVPCYVIIYIYYVIYIYIYIILYIYIYIYYIVYIYIYYILYIYIILYILYYIYIILYIIYIYKTFFGYSTSIMQEENLFMVHPAIEIWGIAIKMPSFNPWPKVIKPCPGLVKKCWGFDSFPPVNCPITMENIGKSPFLMGISSINNGPCSIAMLNYQRVMHFIWILPFLVWMGWVSAVFMEDDSISRWHVCVLFAG